MKGNKTDSHATQILANDALSGLIRLESLVAEATSAHSRH